MKKRIVILGGGFGGAYCAQALDKQMPHHNYEVFLIDRHNYFIFFPLLVEAGTGALEPRHTVVAIRAFLKRSHFLMAEVTGVDFAKQSVSYIIPETKTPGSVSYDHLVFALGSMTRLPDIPGLREHAWELKSLTDAIAIRDHAISMLEAADASQSEAEKAALLHFVVVGANFTGVEVAGEMQIFLHEAKKQYPNIKNTSIKVSLVEIGPQILSVLDEELAAYAHRKLSGRGIDILLKTNTKAIDKDYIHFHDGRSLATRTVIWCAGIQPNPLISQLNITTDARGYIETERDLRVKGFDNVWAIGDCAVNNGPDGKPYPATAQHAVQEGKHLARNLINRLGNRPATPCNVESKGALAALGCRTGVARVMGIKLSGFLAWFLWRTVYLLKMPGLSRKARVALDWTADLFFKRDIVQLGAHKKSLNLPRASDDLAASRHQG